MPLRALDGFPPISAGWSCTHPMLLQEVPAKRAPFRAHPAWAPLPCSLTMQIGLLSCELDGGSRPFSSSSQNTPYVNPVLLAAIWSLPSRSTYNLSTCELEALFRPSAQARRAAYPGDSQHQSASHAYYTPRYPRCPGSRARRQGFFKVGLDAGEAAF